MRRHESNRRPAFVAVGDTRWPSNLRDNASARQDPATRAAFAGESGIIAGLLGLAVIAATVGTALWVVVMRNEANMVRRSDERVAEVVEVGDFDLTVRVESTDGEVVATVPFDHEPTGFEAGDHLRVLVDREDIHRVRAVGQRSAYNAAWIAEPFIVVVAIGCPALAAIIRMTSCRRRRALNQP